MIVVLREALFSSSTVNQTDLIALLHLGFTGRHHIQIEPVDSAIVASWLEGQAPGVRDECELALDEGIKAGSTASFSPIVGVDAVAEPQINPAAGIVILPPHRAVELLQRPFVILVEDNISDRRFLLAVSKPEIREKLTDMDQRGWVTFDNGGGSGIKTRVKDIDVGSWESLRSWVLFDSDALSPGHPSETARELEKVCRGRVPFHRLERRAIENYLPTLALDNWARGSDAKKQKTRAFHKFTAPQRHFFNMKSGFDGDAARAEEAGGLYDNLHANARLALKHGFNRDIAELFDLETHVMQDWWLATDGQQVETAPMLQNLLQLF